MSKPILEPAPPLARRLWSELFCMCGECERMLLVDCGCEQAAEQRKRIADAVSRSGLGETEETTHTRLVDDYVRRFGPESEMAYVRRHAWLDPLLGLLAALLGVVVVIALAERWRRSRATALQTPSKPSWRRRR